MDQNSAMSDCTRKWWQISAVAGVLVALILWLLLGWGFFAALITGIVVAVLGGTFLGRMKCADLVDAPMSRPLGASPSQPTTAKPADVVKPAAAAPAPVMAAPKPAAAAKPAAVKASAKTAAKPAAKKAAAKAVVKAKAASKPKAAKKPAAALARKPVAADGKPDMLTAARAGGADDLKLIKGVGPKLEQTLNALGVYHYDQIATWRKKEVDWVDDNLKFKGRIERDEWAKQAKVLAKGGETEFSKRGKKS
jgi:predicted flap endonuclease-1-like 5' DNA nuclease